MQKKRVVLIPGVGVHKTNQSNRLLDALKLSGKYDPVFLNWSHYFKMPEINWKNFGPRRHLREWLAEVIFDFQQVTYALEHIPVPPADAYIGHSAGSIIALKQKDVPVCVFGSPAALVGDLAVAMETIGPQDINNKTHILNIVNINDPLAFPLYSRRVQNEIIKKYILPIGAHTNYWKNKKCVNLIMDWLDIQLYNDFI